MMRHAWAVLLLVPPQEPPPGAILLVPGLEARELPVRLTNINCLEYAPDGRLFAAGYDGRVHVLTDRDGDGMEDAAEVFWDKKGDLLTPCGIAVAPEGVYVAARGKIALLRDTDGDGRADVSDVAAGGWVQEKHNNNTRNDASGVTLDAEGNLYFSLGCSDFRNPYLLDKEGKAHYDLRSERGTILKVAADRRSREIVATGIRFAVGLAFNRHGDLFATDQEGDTWFPGGNPFDELLHIVPGRHYGFPFRHQRHLPDVVDEPSVVDFGPQHQSTCGFRFNERGFGPQAWRDNAFVTGFSRGKLWRVPLVKTRTGYVGRPALVASFDGLAVDLAFSPKGGVVVACHGGKPDWGSGPQGEGRLWKLTYKEAPQPVLAWPSGPLTVKVAFDRPVSVSTAEISHGAYVRAGDRHERIRPGYKVVAEEQAAPRHRLKVHRVDGDRTLDVLTAAHPWRAHYAVAVGSTECDYDLSGVEATWGDWRGWWPHPTTAVATAWTRGSEEHDRLFSAWTKPGTLTLTGKLRAAGTLVVDADRPFELSGVSSSPQGGRHRAERPSEGVLSITLETGGAPPDLDVSLRRPGDPHLRPLPLSGIAPTWVPEAEAPRKGAVVRKTTAVDGDPAKGREIFFGAQAKCAVCHAFRGEGGVVGPDLTPSLERDPEAVLRDIVEPSSTINPDFVSYVVELADGDRLSGVILTQDERSIVLVDGEGKTRSVPRERVARFKSGATSLMPDGFKALGEAQLRDLVAFLCRGG